MEGHAPSWPEVPSDVTDHVPPQIIIAYIVRIVKRTKEIT
jgi:hypothetical protein